jgi:hypothetical protein
MITAAGVGVLPLRSVMKRHGQPGGIVTDRLRS